MELSCKWKIPVFKCSTTERRHLNNINLSFHDTEISAQDKTEASQASETRCQVRTRSWRFLKEGKRWCTARRAECFEGLTASLYGKKRFFTGRSLIKHTHTHTTSRERERKRRKEKRAKAVSDITALLQK